MLTEINLLRERFTLTENKNSTHSTTSTVSSNRIVLPKVFTGGSSIVIRAQHMHLCIRYAASLIKILETLPKGTFHQSFNFPETLSSVMSSYDKLWLDPMWMAIYKDGQLLFANAELHPAFNIIEEKYSQSASEYESTLVSGQQFALYDEVTSVQYDAGTAMVVRQEQLLTACGIIIRNPVRTSNLRFSLEKSNKGVEPFTAMNLCAAYLEGIQLSVTHGMSNVKLAQGLVHYQSPEIKQSMAAFDRIGEIKIEIDSTEALYNCRYLPEKPLFHEIIKDAELYQTRLING